MAKVLSCKDTGILDCTWEGRAETEEELLRQAKEHAAAVHNETEFSAEEMAAIRAAIREV
jgi:predicted small metal-binding protein